MKILRRYLYCRGWCYRSALKVPHFKNNIPLHTNDPIGILRGFKNYYQDCAFSYKVVHHLTEELISNGEVYITVMADDLVSLLETLIPSGLIIGEEAGVISYNETPVKKFIFERHYYHLYDFYQIGIATAQMILTNSKERSEIRTIKFHL